MQDLQQREFHLLKSNKAECRSFCKVTGTDSLTSTCSQTTTRIRTPFRIYLTVRTSGLSQTYCSNKCLINNSCRSLSKYCTRVTISKPSWRCLDHGLKKGQTNPTTSTIKWTSTLSSNLLTSKSESNFSVIETLWRVIQAALRTISTGTISTIILIPARLVARIITDITGTAETPVIRVSSETATIKTATSIIMGNTLGATLVVRVAVVEAHVMAHNNWIVLLSLFIIETPQRKD